MGKQGELNQLVLPIIESLGFEFWGLEYKPQGHYSLLRVYIEHPEGVTVEHCAAASRQISSVLDVEDTITQRYTLEVSSPGLDRPLFTVVQYQKYINHWVDVRLRTLFEGRRQIKGQLVGVDDQEVVVIENSYEYRLPFDIIDKATLRPSC
jgi:ribosome maturation factor RimP